MVICQFTDLYSEETVFCACMAERIEGNWLGAATLPAPTETRT